MLQKIKNAFKLLKACWRVLMLDKELLVFPLLSGLVLATLVASFLWPLYETGALFEILESMSDDQEIDGNNQYIVMGITFVTYLVSFFVMIFFNAALIACVKIRLAGGDPVVMDGLRASVARLPQIFAWAFVSALVGFILSLLRDKEGNSPNFIVGILGAGWAIAVYFAVPVLVSEKVGPIDAVKRSVSIIKKTWGESLVAEIGLGILSGIAVIVGFALFFIGGIFMESGSTTTAISIWGITVVYALIVALIMSTLGSILKSALYVYAVEGKIPQNFDDNLIKHAFSNKD